MTSTTATQYAVKGTAGKHGKWQVIIQTDPLHETDRARIEEAVQEQRYWQEQWNLTPDAELVTRSWTGNGWTDWAPVADEPTEDAATTPTATNPDGTYTRDFLIWDAKLAARVTGRDLIEVARRLRRVLRVPDDAPTAFVLGLADIKAETNPVIASLRQQHIDASAAFFNAMVDLAELDPSVDIRPLLLA
ncbi:hypothetical protein ACGFJC_47730 [Nonomuraea fuscirosea]|uniref:hypothetical protein n=1 Tax=Nonomuraea fuscirosea TaxID=1291556 RepID=UPI003712869B